MLDEPSARQLLEELRYPDVEADLQNAWSQKGEEGTVEGCVPPWADERFGEKDAWRLLEAAHVEPNQDGESLLLTCNFDGFEKRTAISALAGRRLRDELEVYVTLADLTGEDTDPAG